MLCGKGKYTEWRRTMKKKTAVWMLLLVSCFLLACGKKEEPSGQPTQVPKPTQGQQPEEEEAEEEIRGDGVVLWTIQDVLGKIPERNINLLNERLRADGYSCTLAIRYVPQEINFYERLSELLRTGETDIATFSFISLTNEDMGGNDISLIHEGNVEPLGTYLSTEEGQALWNSCYEDLWEAVKTEGEIYFIPTQASIWDNGYLAFRRDYFTEEEAERVSRNFGELEKLLESKEFPEGVVPVCWWNNIIGNAFLTGHYCLYGAFAELETGTVKNPFEVAEYKELLSQLHSLYQKGLLEEMDRNKRQKTIENGNYAVWYVGETDYLFEKNRNDLILWQIPYACLGRGMGAGVSRQAKQKEAALQLLTLLYTEADYANLLIYGEEGKDYQVIDGFACNMRGEPMQSSYYCYMTGIFDNVIPRQLDYYPVNRKQTKDELYYSDARKESVLLGFYTDTSTFDEQMFEPYRVLSDSQYLWMEENFEEVWEAAAQAFLDAGGEKVMAELERQIKEWKETKRQQN